MDNVQELLNLNMTDYIIFGVIAISTIISLLRGFIKESISLIIWIIGFWVAVKFYQFFAASLAPYISSVGIRHIVAFIAIFLLVLIVGAMFNYLLTFLVTRTGLTGTDRMLGMLFGCVRGILLVSVLLLVIASTSFVQDAWWKDSVLIPQFQPLIDWLRAFLPEKMTTLAGVIDHSSTIKS